MAGSSGREAGRGRPALSTVEGQRGPIGMSSAPDFGTIALYSMWPSQSFVHREDILIRAGVMTISLFPLHGSACSRRRGATLHRQEAAIRAGEPRLKEKLKTATSLVLSKVSTRMKKLTESVDHISFARAPFIIVFRPWGKIVYASVAKCAFRSPPTSLTPTRHSQLLSLMNCASQQFLNREYSFIRTWDTALFLFPVPRAPVLGRRQADGPSTRLSRGWEVLDKVSAQEFGAIRFYSAWPSRSFLYREDTSIRTRDVAIFRLPVAKEARQGPVVGRWAEDGPSTPLSRGRGPGAEGS